MKSEMMRACALMMLGLASPVMAQPADTVVTPYDGPGHDFAGPIVAGFPSGHTTGPTWTLPLGVNVRVSTTPKPSLFVEEAPVE